MKIIAFLLLCFTITLLLSACPAKRTLPSPNLCSNGVLDPGEVDVDCGGPCPSCATSSDSDYTIIKTLFATNRNVVQSEGLSFTSIRDTLKYGVCDITIPNDNHSIGEIESPKWWKLEFSEDVSKHITIPSVRLVSKSQFYFEESKNYKDRLFVFIHGYNVEFEEAAKRTGQMAFDMNFDGIPIFFSWPSKGLMRAYFHDSENIKYSISHIKKFINEILVNFPTHEVFLIAHSMGNRGLVRALIDLYSEYPQFKSRINHVILAAPDIDADVFVNDIAPKITSNYSNITLYSSSTDKALILSKEFNGHQRAGDAGDGIVILEGIETIDATNLDTGFISLGHSYFGSNRSVIADIDLIFDNGSKADERFGLMKKKAGQNYFWVFKN